jgi:hypothetical protein
MKYFLIGISTLFVFLSACRKPEPTEEDLKAVFYIKGLINGNTVDISAGDNNVFMHPDFQDDTLGIRSFVGRIGDLRCVLELDCPESVEIRIREKERESNQRRSISENIYPTEYPVRGPAEFLFRSFKATFKSKSTPVGIPHFWDFGDGVTSMDINPVHVYVREQDSIVNPVLVVANGTGCSNSISYQTHFNSGCDVDFFPTFKNGRLSWSTSPNLGRSELWDLTNGYLPLGSGNLPPNDSVFTACILSTDTVTGCVSNKCKNIILDTNVVGCVANYDVIKESKYVKDVRDFFETTIIWTDKNGKKYSSQSFDQPVESKFEILSVESFKNDPMGRATKKVTVKFSLRLFGDSAIDFVDFESDKSVIAIAYQ